MGKHLVRIAICVAVLLLASAIRSGPAGGSEIFLPPTDRPIADPYRPPDGPYGAGNRGIEYDTRPGDRITAAATGEVAFAGAVAGSLFVTIRHPSGLRTTYGFLESVFVRVGDRVERGALVGAASRGFHFTVRDGEAYVDPSQFFGEVRVRVRLIGSDRPSVVGPWPIESVGGGADWATRSHQQTSAVR